MNASSAACSLACTSPRWRSGSDSVGSRMIAPTTGMPIASIASAASRRCRSLATRLSTTPAIRTAGIVGGKALGDGRRRLRLAGDVEHQQHRQAVAAARGRPPRRSGPGCRGCRRTGPWRFRRRPDRRRSPPRAASAVEQGRRHRPAVEIDAGRAGRRGVEAGIDVVRPGLRAAHAQGRAGASARSSPIVTLVLPEPERGAPMMRPRALMPIRLDASRSARRASTTMSPTTISAGDDDAVGVGALGDDRAERRDQHALVAACRRDRSRPPASTAQARPRSSAAAIAGRFFSPI